MSKRVLKMPSKAQRRVFAKETLLQARKCQEELCVLEAEFLYTEGMQMLRELISEECLLPKREQYCQEQRQHERQLSVLQTQIQRHLNSSKLVARYTLLEGARGHSYHTLFHEYMNDKVFEIHIYEPYLATKEHYRSLVSFLETALKCCHKLNYVRVFTRPDCKNAKLQLSVCKAIRQDLSKAHITFSFRFRRGMSERKIVMGNGVIIKTDHGLHIYQPNDFLYSLGVCDYDFRKCWQTQVDVWQTKAFYECCMDENDKCHGDASTVCQ